MSCELCKETVKHYDKKEICDDEIRLACDAKLSDVKQEQESQSPVKS